MAALLRLPVDPALISWFYNYGTSPSVHMHSGEPNEQEAELFAFLNDNGIEYVPMVTKRNFQPLGTRGLEQQCYQLRKANRALEKER